jgi:RecB family exonuclease
VDEDEIRRVGAVAGFRQCQSVQRALDSLIAQSESRIGPEALDKLIKQATAVGSENTLMKAQAGAGGRVRDPGAAIEAFDEVLWWSMGAVPLVSAYPWSRSERAGLATAGVALPDTGQLLERQARNWYRPLLNARKHLTLMLPAEGEEHHPLWLTLASLLDQPPIETVESVLQSGDTRPGVTVIPHRPLPPRRRWWQVPAGSIRGWQQYKASYSSLQNFIYNPYRWALTYPAQLRASALLTLPSDSRLYGSLAHRAIERLYRQSEALTWSVEQARAWFERTLPEILLEEGAVLFMPGRSADREILRQRVRHSLGELHRQLRAAGATRVEPEKELEADTPLGKLGGSSDLLVTLPADRQAVIDMKWRGRSWFADEIKAQAHIQLAIYARMVERNTSRWPAVAYFILQDAHLLPTQDGVFPGATPVVVAGSSTALVWQKLETTWGWRREQIEAGHLELVTEDVEPTAESTPPALGLAIELQGDRFNAYVYLAGWAADA